MCLALFPQFYKTWTPPFKIVKCTLTYLASYNICKKQHRVHCCTMILLSHWNLSENNYSAAMINHCQTPKGTDYYTREIKTIPTDIRHQIHQHVLAPVIKKFHLHSCYTTKIYRCARGPVLLHSKRTRHQNIRVHGNSPDWPQQAGRINNN